MNAGVMLKGRDRNLLEGIEEEKASSIGIFAMNKLHFRK
jgi:hypothetical protein